MISIWVGRLSAWASTPAVWGLFVTGAIIYIVSQWHVRLVALLTQYFLIGILFSRLFADRPEMALVKMLVGWLICGALHLSARIREEVNPREAPRHGKAEIPFRLVTLFTLTVAAAMAAQHYPLPFVPPDLTLACYLLAVLALLFIGTEADAVVVGVGLLNLLTALDLFYSAQDPAILVTGMILIIELLVGLAVSYLAVRQVPEGEP